MGIERFDRDTTPETVVGTLKRDGVAIVEGVLSPERVDRVVDELQPMFDRVPISGDDWTGRRAQIVHTAVKYSATYRELLLDPFFLGTVDGVLGMNCHSWRLSASSVMTVHGGGGRQPLHRDEDIYEHFVDRSPEAPPYILGFMLALTDFTEANGATRYVPGSNQWLRDRTPGESEVSRAVMPRGSLAIWLGATFHGLGVRLLSIGVRGRSRNTLSPSRWFATRRKPRGVASSRCATWVGSGKKRTSTARCPRTWPRRGPSGSSRCSDGSSTGYSQASFRGATRPAS